MDVLRGGTGRNRRTITCPNCRLARSIKSLRVRWCSPLLFQAHQHAMASTLHIPLDRLSWSCSFCECTPHLQHADKTNRCLFLRIVTTHFLPLDALTHLVLVWLSAVRIGTLTVLRLTMLSIARMLQTRNSATSSPWPKTDSGSHQSNSRTLPSKTNHDTASCSSCMIQWVHT